MKLPQQVVIYYLPVKTSIRYEKEYDEFTTWRKGKNVQGVNEDVLLCYLSGLSNNFALNSLWTKNSMLKTCLKLHDLQVRTITIHIVR